jgi:hypothetical protein
VALQRIVSVSEKQPVPVTGLRVVSVPGSRLEVSLEIEGRWVVITSEPTDAGSITSHTIEAAGIRAAMAHQPAPSAKPARKSAWD